MISHCSWAVELSDKDSGFVLVPRAIRSALILRNMKAEWHSGEPADEHRLLNNVTAQYRKVIASIFKATDDDGLRKALYSARGQVIAPLQATVKSHTEAGLVKPRILHNC